MKQSSVAPGETVGRQALHGGAQVPQGPTSRPGPRTPHHCSQLRQEQRQDLHCPRMRPRKSSTLSQLLITTSTRAFVRSRKRCGSSPTTRKLCATWKKSARKSGRKIASENKTRGERKCESITVTRATGSELYIKNLIYWTQYNIIDAGESIHLLSSNRQHLLQRAPFLPGNT